MDKLVKEFDFLKENSRISKQALNKLIKGSIKEIMPTQKVKTVTNCNDCPYKGLSEEKLAEKCNDFCTFKNVSEVVELKELSEIRKTIINPNTNKETIINMPYVVYNGQSVSLSKTAIKQYLLYNFLNVNKYHIIKNISLKYIAELLSVSISTVKRNNEIMQELNLIHATYVGLNMYDISVIGRDRLHATEEEDGKGYLTLSKELLFKFFKISNVNKLKIELKKILISDYTTNVHKDRKITDITISSFKNILPFYLKKGRQSIKKLLTEKDSMFKVTNIDFARNTFELNVANYENKDTLRAKLEEQIKTDLLEFLKSSKIDLVSENETIIEDKFQTTEDMIAQLENKEIYENDEDKFGSRLRDLVSLSIEYGAQIIKNVLKHIKRRYIMGEGIAINNIGGFVRSLIRNLIAINGSCITI